MTERHEHTPENPQYWQDLYDAAFADDYPVEDIVRSYMISEEGLKRILESGGPVIKRDNNGDMVIVEGDQD